MSDKKQQEEGLTTLSVLMSKENRFKVKEKAIKERTTIRKLVHFALGLKMEEKKKK